MAQPPPDAAAPVRMRILSRHACDSCRKRNRRCSGMQPCAECTGYGYECIFSSQSSRSTTSMGLEVTDYHGDGRHTVMNSAQVIPLRIGGEVDVIDHGTVVLRPPTPRTRTENASAAEPDKARFENSSSAIAFPRDVGIDLKMANPPRLHSYAWHIGYRPVCQNRRFQNRLTHFSDNF
jgi:hypothetical protein